MLDVEKLTDNELIVLSVAIVGYHWKITEPMLKSIRAELEKRGLNQEPIYH